MPPIRVEVVVTEHDAERPWIVVATRRDVLEVDDPVAFWPTALERWPEPRYGVRVVRGL